ncbi:hypothetical protein SAV31267_009840 [Streptomyces avermitilis]|uniref:Ketoreductase domain-containing protein n=1 Tax=Streptomyces avermitilis TaxID=33903 RepID=A0A4D4MJ08_STRAX|nr:hypothetical protein SAV31267_009840 [Streptomyces avermitilis]
MLGPLPAVCYVHARLVGETAGVRRFDLTICDEQGHVLATLKDFAGRTPSAPAVEVGQPRLYEPYWRAAAEPAPGTAAGTLALAGGLPGLRDALAATGMWRRIVDIPEHHDGLADLLAGLADPDGLHFAFVRGFTEPAAFDPAATGTEALEDSLDRSCFAMLDLLRAVESGALPGRLRCLLIHPQDGGEDRPEHAALAGFARSTAAIAPRFELVTLGVSGDVAVPELASAVAVELAAAPRAAGAEVRRTAAGREVRALRPVTDGRAAGGSLAELPLRDRGVYVVTGGSGAIGRVLAEYLARTYRARLVLIGRSEPDAEALEWQRGLAGLGAEVLAVRADVAGAEELAAALTTARERFGELNGVFHLAGVADDGRATDGDRERFAAVLAAKTRGLVHLDQLTRNDPLDLFVVFSSVSSLVGDFGAASYATANRFADLYTALRASWVRRGSRTGRSLSLGWPLWSVGGVDGLVREQELAAYRRRSGMRPLTAEQGLAAFERSFAVDAPWLVPAWGDPAVIDAALADPGSRGNRLGLLPARRPLPRHRSIRRPEAPPTAGAPGWWSTSAGRCPESSSCPPGDSTAVWRSMTTVWTRCWSWRPTHCWARTSPDSVGRCSSSTGRWRSWPDTCSRITRTRWPAGSPSRAANGLHPPGPARWPPLPSPSPSPPRWPRPLPPSRRSRPVRPRAGRRRTSRSPSSA